MEANNYTEKTQQALIRAQRIATERGNPQIEPEHMLLAPWSNLMEWCHASSWSLGSILSA